ncbi:MAG: dihydroorotate dehydrogenase (fumarate) [Planctomycetota bacterium]|jgi:dihydroorotate dehydrogenase (fumarate)
MSIDLSTTWLGLELDHPLIPGASPMSLVVDNVKRLEDYGAGAIIMPSLFEEQIVGEEMAMRDAFDFSQSLSAEAGSFLPDPDGYTLGPHEYVEHIARLKEQTEVKIIASLNGASAGGWIEYAEIIAEAGADALELNVYRVVTNPEDTSASVEDEVVSMVRDVKLKTNLPLSVKISPFYSSVPNLASRLKDAGTDGLVIFNRFFEPHMDPVELDMTCRLEPSNSNILGMRLRWLGILYGDQSPDLSVTGGVHAPVDVVKSVFAGASSVQLVSALMIGGASYLQVLREGVENWLEENEYDSLMKMRGAMSIDRCPQPAAYTRANYVRLLRGWADHWSPKF